jgi:hypothetical protein
MARHQIRLLESLYITRTKGPYYQDVAEWFEVNRDGPIHFCRYHAVGQSYAEAFGRDNVKIFLLEDMQDDALAFAERLCAFMDIGAEEGRALLAQERHNVRTSHRHHLYSKLRKRWGPQVSLGPMVPAPLRDGIVHLLTSGRPANVSLPIRCIAEMESYYREDNRQLAEQWGLPLAKYGYPL